MSDKAALRKKLREARRDHVAAQPDTIRALLFHRPPRPLMQHIGDSAVIALYHAIGAEAPAASYARFFKERGHTIALPRFADENDPMEFAEFVDPFDESDLVSGPFGLSQPSANAISLEPDVVFTPLVGFTESGRRLGQGGGHYDRWFAEHPDTGKIGLAWNVQLIEPESALPHEPHDIPLDFVVTPTQIYGEV